MHMLLARKILQFCKKPCQHRPQDAFCLDIATSCHSSHRENPVGDKACFRAKFLFPRIHGPDHDLWIRSIKLQITCCLVFPFLAKNNLFNWSCGSEVVLTSVLTDYSEGIRSVSGQLYRRSFAILTRTLHAKECKSN